LRERFEFGIGVRDVHVRNPFRRPRHRAWVEERYLGHQAKGENANHETRRGLCQQVNEGVIIGIVMEDLGPVVAAMERVVDVSSRR
jgi:hypothetical protein